MESRGFNARFGHRLGAASGVLGSLDGLQVDYRLAGGALVNGIIGYPDLFTGDGPAWSNPVLGLSYETETFGGAWQASAYVVDEAESEDPGSGIVGAAVRHPGVRSAVFGSAEFDPSIGALSALTVSGVWRPASATTFSATCDVRGSRVHERQAHYLKQTMESIAGWRWRIPQERIDLFTRDPSTRVTTLGIGLSQALSERLELTSDLLRLAVARERRDTEPESSAEYFHRAKLTGKDLLFAGDTNSIALRTDVTRSARSVAMSLDGDYPLTSSLRVSPSLQAGYRREGSETAAEWHTKPSVKMEFRWNPVQALHMEAGGEWSMAAAPDQTLSDASYFLKLDYKAYF
jgi:hypothetical protein